MKPLYNYGISQEDARTERRALDIREGDRLLCVASAGEVPLNLLAMGTVAIEAVDISRTQLFLCRLKMAACRVLEPVLESPEPVRLICREAPLVDLLADLSVHKLDAVLADGPLSPALNIRAYNHLLGESGVSFFCAPGQAEQLKDGFPASLDGARTLMPSSGSNLRRNLESWFERHDVKPRVVAEIEKSRAGISSRARLTSVSMPAARASKSGLRRMNCTGWP